MVNESGLAYMYIFIILLTHVSLVMFFTLQKDGVNYAEVTLSTPVTDGVATVKVSTPRARGVVRQKVVGVGASY